MGISPPEAVVFIDRTVMDLEEDLEADEDVPTSKPKPKPKSRGWRRLAMVATLAVAAVTVLHLHASSVREVASSKFEDLYSRGPRPVKIWQQCGGGSAKEKLCVAGCVCSAKNKYFMMCKPPPGAKFCDKKAIGSAAVEAKKKAQSLQDKLWQAEHNFNVSEKQYWKAKGQADWWGKKMKPAAAEAGKLWWTLNETKKEKKFKDVPRILNQSLAAQKKYDDIAKIVQKRNTERDEAHQMNMKSKGLKESLAPQVKAAWDAFAKWDVALHPPKVKKSKHKHRGAKKRHGHEGDDELEDQDLESEDADDEEDEKNEEGNDDEGNSKDDETGSGNAMSSADVSDEISSGDLSALSA